MEIATSDMNTLPDKKTFELISRTLAINEAFVEKDWYVTQVIDTISKISYHDFKIIFAGGTALSKAHRLIQRFSEDVDFRVIAPEKFQNRKSLSNFKRTIIESLRNTGFQIKEKQVIARDENRFFSIDINYETLFAREDALRSHIQIEITVKNPQLLPMDLPVFSFVTELTKQTPEVEKISCIHPAENAADKLSAITWRIPDRIRGDQSDDPSIVRHIHDLAILKNIALKHQEFPKVVISAMKEDDHRSKNNTIFTGLSINEKFHQMLSILDTDTEYSKEYDRFVKGVSYAKEGTTPDFETGVKAVKQLAKKVLQAVV